MSSRTSTFTYMAGDELDGRYVLRRDLGKGAAGQVFEVVHLFTGRSAALKVVAPAVATAARPELRARLVREARALAALRHPNIVQVLDGGELGDGTPYLVMELLTGRTVEGLLAARGHISTSDAVAIALQLCEGLAEAHATGVVHRDVKPSNIVVALDPAGDEIVKLVDFGIAQVEAAQGEKLTSVGAVIGTPAYMSPEQLMAEADVDAKTDVYSLGVTLFECLTGRVPYEGNYPQVLLQVCSRTPVPDVRDLKPEVSSRVAEIIRKAMARERSARFAGAREMRHELAREARDGDVRTRLLAARKPTSPTTAEPRRAPRAAYATPAQLTTSAEVIHGRVEDISVGGVLLISRQPCRSDERAALRFALPIEGTIVDIPVVVRWVSASRGAAFGGPYALGLEFISPDRDVIASLARYVSLMGRAEPA